MFQRLVAFLSAGLATTMTDMNTSEGGLRGVSCAAGDGRCIASVPRASATPPEGKSGERNGPPPARFPCSACDGYYCDGTWASCVFLEG